MIQESPIVDEVEDFKKRKIRLNREEKDHIEMIASTLGKDPKEVQEVFLAMVAYIALNLYQGKSTFIIPYLMKVDVKSKKTVVHKGFEISEEYSIESSPAFHNLFTKIQNKETTWMEEFFLSTLFNQLNTKVNG